MNWKLYFKNIFRVLNRVWNTVTGGHWENGWSSRAGYWLEKDIRQWPANLIDTFLGTGHCARAWEKEDDTYFKNVADPDGKYLVPMLVFWVPASVALVGWIGHGVYCLCVTLWELFT